MRTRRASVCRSSCSTSPDPSLYAKPGLPGFFTPDCSQKSPSSSRLLYLSFCSTFSPEDAVPWILLLLISLFSAPSFAVAIPGVTTGTPATQQNTPPPNPMLNRKKPPTVRLPTSLKTIPPGRSSLASCAKPPPRRRRSRCQPSPRRRLRSKKRCWKTSPT